METYRTEEESMVRNVAELADELAIARKKNKELQKKLDEKPTLWKSFLVTILPPVIFFGVVIAGITAVVSNCYYTGVERDNDYVRKRTFVNTCLVGKGHTERIEGVLVCRGGEAEGSTL